MAETTMCRGARSSSCWRFELRSASCGVVLLLILGLQSCVHPCAAVDYVVNNNGDTPGALRFRQEFSDAVTVLGDATSFIQGAFSLSTPKSSITTVTLTVESFDGVAQTGGSEIHLSSDYVAAQSSDTAAMHYEIEGVLFHESTHVWQNNNGDYGGDQFFRGTIEGVADWIRLKAEFPSVGWSPRAKGGNWYDGYTTTAYFLDWIDSTQKANFVNQLNLKMAEPWSNDFFLQIVGRSVDALWTDYQNSI